MVVRCRRVPPVRILDVIFPNICRSVQLWFNFHATTLRELKCNWEHQSQVPGECKEVGTLKRESHEIRYGGTVPPVPAVRILEVIFPNLSRSVQLWSNFASTLTQLPPEQ